MKGIENLLYIVKYICVTLFVFTCYNKTHAQPDSIFLPELSIKNYDLYQNIAEQLKINNINRGTLLLTAAESNKYKTKKINTVKYKEHPLILFFTNKINCNSDVTYYTENAIGYFYINDVCVIADKLNYYGYCLDKINLFDSIQNEKGRFFSFQQIKDDMCKDNSIDYLSYTIYNNKLKKFRRGVLSEGRRDDDNIKYAEKRTKELTIKRIYKIKNVYVISGIDDKGHVFTILSQKNIANNKCKIKEGNTYKFFLVPYLDCDFHDSDESDYILCGGDPTFQFNINVNNKVIKIKTYNQDINFYETPNLNGLYYIPYNGTEASKEYPYFRAHINWARSFNKNVTDK